jgi:hypothetical protein
MKTSGMEAYSDADLERIAEEFEDIAAKTRASGTASTEQMDYIAKANRYIVLLRARIPGKKEPGIRQHAV